SVTEVPEATPTPTPEEDVVEDPEVVEVGEVSSDLGRFVTSASVNGLTQNSDGTYTARPGKEYSVDLNFSEVPGGIQFANTMTYPLPAGFTAADGESGTFSITVEDGGNYYEVSGNSYTVNGGVVTVNLNTSHEHYRELAAASNAQFFIEISGSFDKTTNHIEWGGSATPIDLTFDEESRLKVKKEGYFDSSDGKAHFTVTVESEGTSNNVVVTDTITGTALTYDGNAVNSLGTGSAATQGNGFVYTIPQMKDGEKAEITYTASIDPTKISQQGTVEQTSNGVKVKSDEVPGEQEASKDLQNTITWPLDKKVGEVTAGENGIKTIPWNVIYNQGSHLSAAGRVLTDSINPASLQYMKYSGDVTIDVYDTNGAHVRTDHVTPGSGSWTYQVPTTDTAAYEYRCSYNTTVDTSNLLTDVHVDNTVHDDNSGDGGKHSAGTDVGVDENAKIGVEKHATKVTWDNISWEINLKVPAGGLTSAVVTEEFPHENSNPNHQDVLDGEITVDRSNLLEGEDFTIDNSDPKKAIIKFTQDGKDGLKGSGNARTITITLTTKNSSEWLAASENAAYLKDHTNKVSFEGNGTVVTAEATGRPINSTINKTGKIADNLAPEDNMPYFRYEVTMTGLTEDGLNLTDTFDDRLEYYEPPYQDESGQLYGGNQYYQGMKSNGQVTVSGTTSPITMTMSGADLARDNGALYSHYRLVYFLKVKDQEALDSIIAESVANGGNTSLHNVVASETAGSSEADVNYAYQGLKKSIDYGQSTLNADISKGQVAKVHFKILVNPAGAIIAGEDMVEVTDVPSSSLTILYETIHMTNSDSGEAVDGTYSGDSSSLVFQVPDGTPVTIEYDARISGHGQIPVSNTASCMGFTDTASANADVHSSGGGTASTYSINVMKYEEGNMAQKLPGATFALLDENQNPIVDLGENEVTFTTDENGMVKVSGSQDADGWTLTKGHMYYLVETVAPEGYELDSELHSFVIGDEMNEGLGLYLNNVTLPIGNVPAVETPTPTP
ncbi:MAG: SpaA isopeptide-forming pilin-related protein, partial [Eubacteriales bacterium]|nr:SpaA isopeptide-forming pilin-related protein [Eubacteriales bacterium]